MSQLARQLEVREPYKRQQRANDTQPVIRPRKRITKAEKALWSLGIIMILSLSIFIVSKQANIYLVNHHINSIEASIQKNSEENKKLNIQKTKLMDPKRIMNYAEQHGYKLNINNVKVIK
ncbi:MAG: cell division protein FtsL [Tuberibacillus sp.]